MAVVYRHRRVDNNKVFYVGIGKYGHRPYSLNNRNRHWKSITNKSDYTVEILARDISYEDAKELEVFLIKSYGRLDLGNGLLVNMTDGGEGTHGLIVKQSTRKLLSSIHKGKKYRDYSSPSKENIEKVRESNSKPVNQKDLNGNIIGSFKSLTEANKKLKLH
jgi:hypothetical protein